eukprot:6472224-Amphidinium_carterae.1
MDVKGAVLNGTLTSHASVAKHLGNDPRDVARLALEAAGRVQPLLLMKSRKYDETEMKVAVQWDGKCETAAESAGKVVVVERELALLLKVHGDPDKYLQIVMPHTTYMAVVKSMTGAMQFHLIDKAMKEMVPDLVQRPFPHVFELSCSDEHASSVCAEKARSQLGNERCSAQRVRCAQDRRSCKGHVRP